MADEKTIRVYDARAEEYATQFSSEEPDLHLKSFVADMPAGGRVLDLGCGPGNAAAFMRDAGLGIVAMAASASMIELAQKLHNIQAQQASFDYLDKSSEYDGIWANFSLLHALRTELPRHLQAIARALKPGGQLHIGMKTGTGQSRDKFGRIYTFVTVEEVHKLLKDAGLQVTNTCEGSDKGLAGTDDPFVLCRGVKNA